MSKPLIEVKDLKVYFKQKSPKLLSFKPGILKAVDQVSFSIEKGKTFGLVGESGSGKSTIGKAILRYHKPTGGEIFYEGTEIGAMGEKELLPYRKKMQSVFQDPYSSLDPSHTVQDIICEPMAIHKMYTQKERKERAKELIRVVGLKEQDLLKYPHEFSGGQRQRISIARALSVQPEFVVCDEPISALDVSLQAQIVQMLQDLQEKYGLTYLFISHDLSVVEHISDPAKGLGCKTLFATHYHELTDLEGTISGVKNYNIAVKKRGEDITFLRRIVRGPADDSYGIEVAKLAGLPGTVTRRAHEVLRALEATAPKNKVEQMDFDALQEYNSPAVPSEVLEKLDALDVETLTPIEALNFLYELKKTLKGSLNG